MEGSGVAEPDNSGTEDSGTGDAGTGDAGTNGASPTDIGGDETDALIPRLRVIESQPLATRAAAFSQIYDGLQSILGGGAGSGTSGGMSAGEAGRGADAPRH